MTLVVNALKFGVSSTATRCGLEDVKTVVADEGVREGRETLDAIEPAGGELVIV